MRKEIKYKEIILNYWSLVKSEFVLAKWTYPHYTIYMNTFRLINCTLIHHYHPITTYLQIYYYRKNDFKLFSLSWNWTNAITLQSKPRIKIKGRDLVINYVEDYSKSSKKSCEKSVTTYKPKKYPMCVIILQKILKSTKCTNPRYPPRSLDKNNRW